MNGILVWALLTVSYGGTVSHINYSNEKDCLEAKSLITTGRTIAQDKEYWDLLYKKATEQCKANLKKGSGICPSVVVGTSELKSFGSSDIKNAWCVMERK